MRVADEVRPRAVGEVAFQDLQVEAGPLRPGGQRAGDHLAADALDPVEEGRVSGGVDDDAVAGLGDDLEDLHDARHDVRDQARGGGIGVPAVVPDGETGKRVREPAGERVTGVAAADGGGQGRGDGFGERGVHFRDAQGQDVRGKLPPLDAAPIAELLGTVGGEEGVRVRGQRWSSFAAGCVRTARPRRRGRSRGCGGVW